MGIKKMNILAALTHNTDYNQVFQDRGELHIKTICHFDHRIIDFTRMFDNPLRRMDKKSIIVTYLDGVEKEFDDISWKLFGSNILKNVPLSNITLMDTPIPEPVFKSKNMKEILKRRSKESRELRKRELLKKLRK